MIMFVMFLSGKIKYLNSRFLSFKSNGWPFNIIKYMRLWAFN